MTLSRQTKFTRRPIVLSYPYGLIECVSDTRIEAFEAACNSIAVQVEYCPLPDGLRGCYKHPDRLIIIDSRLSTMHTLATLAHEYVHALSGHDGPQPEAVERRVDEKAAMLLVSPVLYEQAEAVYGAHPGAIAKELGLPRWVIEAWQRVVARSLPTSLPGVSEGVA